MLSLSYKLLFRKKSTIAAILALALLVAIVASMNTIVNFIDFQTSAIGQLASVGDKYLVLNKNCTSLSDSHISRETEDAFNFSGIGSFFAQKILNGNLQTALGNYTVAIRGVENLTAYLNAQSAYVNGTMAKNVGEADIGVLLAKTAQLNRNDYADVTVGNSSLTVKIVGVARTQTQLDSELIVPIETADYLTNNGNLSFIEFTFKSNINRQDAINSIASLLPKDVEVVKVQQTALFLQESTGETLNFLTVWSIVVYVLVSAASYVIATRLIVESEYELAMLKAIGAKRLNLSSTIFTYTMLTAVAGSVLGIALGIVGTQIASTGLRLVWQNILVTPFLELAQLEQILALSLLFSALGCIYPAFKSVQRKL
jgi:ABC-type lipoprotein release transport system permease subunit